MKMIMLMMITMVLCVTLASAFTIETSSYTTELATTGLSGSEVETTSYQGRFLWDYNQPSSDGETTFYWMHPGYFEQFFAPIPYDIIIDLVNPINGLVTNNNSITFEQFTNTTGVISNCNLLVYQNSILHINQTSNVSVGAHNWTNNTLSENSYTWTVICENAQGNKSYSPTNAFSIDNTAPIVTINEPDDGDTVNTPVLFDININETNPDYITININGTLYNYSYNNGANTFSAAIPEGTYDYNITAYDTAGNSAFLGNYELTANNDAVSITNILFSPSPPKTGIDNTMNAVIDGDFSTVIISINIAGSGWTNYTVTSFSGTGPYNYAYILDDSQFAYGDTLQQQWYVLDDLSNWQQSDIYSAIVQQATTGGGGGSFPTTAGGKDGTLIIVPDPIQINNLRGALVEIKNNGSKTCKIKTITIEDRLASTELQDNFKVNTLDTNLELQPGKSITALIKPEGLRGIAGVGAIIVTSEDCGTADADLGVNIHFTDVLIDEINRITNEVINYITNLFV
jgi:hypothetical protein